MRESVTERGNDDALLADTLARLETQYVVIDNGGNFAILLRNATKYTLS